MDEATLNHEKTLPDGWTRPTGYTHGILTQPGRILFMAGKVGWDKDQKFHSTELVPQFEQALKNIIAIINKAGGEAKHIVRITCFCKDKDQYLASRKELGKAWKDIMGDHYPCMSMIFVSDLLNHPAVIEMEATAVIPNKKHPMNFTITA